MNRAPKFRRHILSATCAVGAALLVGAPRDASAHPVLADTVVADLSATELRLTVRSTLRDPVVATGAAPAEAPYFRRAELESALAEYGPYLLAHVHLDADGVPLTGRIVGARLVEATDRPIHHAVDLEKLHAEVDLVYALDATAATNHLGLAFDILADREYSPGKPWSLAYRVDVRGARSFHAELAQRARFVFEPAPVPAAAATTLASAPLRTTGFSPLAYVAASGSALALALLFARRRRSRSAAARTAAAPLAFAVALASSRASAEPRIYLAPDDHTDFIWSASEAEYISYFPDMLDYYVGRADADIAGAVAAPMQSRFTADGSYWVWTYEKARTPAQLAHLMDRVKSGHINVNMPPLDIMHGCMPTEAVLRQMYYAGSLERRFGLRFKMAGAMENAAMPWGVASLWAGAGALYTWNGICSCASDVPNRNDRANEIYRWVGPGGSSLVMKWFSYSGTNQSIGGYAEARAPAAAIDYVTNNADFNNRYKAPGGAKYEVIGAFGEGWDDRITKDLKIQQGAQTANQPGTRLVFVSNEVDFFDDFVKSHGAALPTESVSYGIEWDRQAASAAAQSGRMKRSMETLRVAESMAYYVASKDAAFWDASKAARDLAHIDMGLYFEHDLTTTGPGGTGVERTAFQKRVAGEVEAYTTKLGDDARAALGAKIGAAAGSTRFFVHNALSWVRTDVVDLPYEGKLPVKIVDVKSLAEVPAQVVTAGGKQRVRIIAHDVPSMGYRVYEARQDAPSMPAGAPAIDAGAGTISNGKISVTVSANGAITSFKDAARGELVGAGGVWNELAPGAGALAPADVGQVSASLVATSTAGLAHTSRVTVYRELDRVEIENRITQGFGDERAYKFDFALPAPDTWHEEVGGIARAKLASNGGTYSTRNARYDYLSVNHFVVVGSASAGKGVVLSNADAFIFQLGNSTLGALDEATPTIRMIAGGVYDGIANQGGDSSFLHRFALSALGGVDLVLAMRASLEHQDPLVAGAVTGASPAPYPDDQYALLTVSDPNVLAWAVKPGEDGPGTKVVVRLWNLGKAAATPKVTFSRKVVSATRLTHVETPLGAITQSGSAVDLKLAPQELLTFSADLGVETGPPPNPTTPPGDPSLGADAGASPPPASGDGDGSRDGGCGCRTVGLRGIVGSVAIGVVAALAGAVMVLRRRRRRP